MKAGECYSFGHYVGRVIGGGRKWRIGRAKFWVAENGSGRWIGSYYSREAAVAAVFAEHQRLSTY